MRHYYHLYVDGPWQAPAVEHFTALSRSGLHAPTFVTLVGRPRNRTAARRFLSTVELNGGAVVEFDDGWEQRTLEEVWHAVPELPADEPVLYCHGKGSGNPSPFQDVWRRSMTMQLVDDWRRCVDLLEFRDAVGCHWLVPGRHPYPVTSPYFGGNFWWATAGYLATLGECSTESRHDAEMWIGRGHPRVFDLLPGWPCLQLFKIESATVPRNA